MGLKTDLRFTRIFNKAKYKWKMVKKKPNNNKGNNVKEKKIGDR